MRTSPLDFRSPSMVVPVPIRLMDALVVSGFLLFIISGVLSGLLLNIVFIFLCSTYVYLPRSNFYILTIKRRRGSYFVRNSFTDRKSTRLNSSHGYISYAVFCLK